MQSSLAVRRADGANAPSGKRSVKICRPHSTASQRKRRAITTSSNDTPRQRQVRHAAPITAMHASRNRPARWTKTKSARRADGENGPVCLVERTFDNKPTRHQTGAAKCLLHGADSPKGSATRIQDCIKFESEPKLHAE